jgi:hypothetical protein
MSRLKIAIAFCACLATGFPVQGFAQTEMSARLSSDRLGGIQTGYYLAGDNLPFTLEPYGDKYLLRFPGQPEVFVLYVDHGMMGGRVLKYDAGGVAIRVSAWGGMTLYTDSAPQGLPTVKNDAPTRAQRVGPLALPTPSLADLQKAANDEAAHLAYSRKLKLSVSADWNAFADNETLRGQFFDAMENAVRGIDRFTADARARDRFVEKVDSIRMAVSRVPTLALRGKTLVVTFVPDTGYAGRASSRAISQALGTILKTGFRR